METAFTMGVKNIVIVMTPNLHMATIGTVGSPIPLTTGITLKIQATSRDYSVSLFYIYVI